MEHSSEGSSSQSVNQGISELVWKSKLIPYTQGRPQVNLIRDIPWRFVRYRLLNDGL